MKIDTQECIIIYPCLNGDRITLMGKPSRYDGHAMDTQYYLISGAAADPISTLEAQNIMAEEGFFEVLQGECPTTASGVVYTKDHGTQSGF